MKTNLGVTQKWVMTIIIIINNFFKKILLLLLKKNQIEKKIEKYKNLDR